VHSPRKARAVQLQGHNKQQQQQSSSLVQHVDVASSSCSPTPAPAQNPIQPHLLPEPALLAVTAQELCLWCAPSIDAATACPLK
jgi:hypothetical protein